MTARLAIRPQADRDIDEIVDYLAQRIPRQRFVSWTTFMIL